MTGLDFSGAGLLGSGLFAGDYTTWGLPELGVIGALGYLVYVVYMSAIADSGRSRYRR